MPTGGKKPRASSSVGGVAAALDEARFGAARILNLRADLPTGAQAARRAESWLRERQALGGGEVLVITGRGRGSIDGIPVVRDAVLRLFPALRRGGVVALVHEHTPGSFVVRLAPLQALVEAPRRRSRPSVTPPPVRQPALLVGLDAATLAVLRRLAVAALASLGVRGASDDFVADEMVRQFSTLTATLPPAPSTPPTPSTPSTPPTDRERALRALLERALDEFGESSA